MDLSRIKSKVSAIQKAMAAAAAGVEEIRQAIADLRAERRAVEGAPVPPSEASAALGKMLDRWEMAGENRYIGIEPIIRAATTGQVPQLELHQSATIGHVLGLLVPLLRQQLEAALKSAAEGHYETVPPGLPAAERQRRLAEIDHELARLEALEEQAVQAAAEGGLHIDRRGDANPASVLGLVE